ncbi:LacI family DNA-binding transcriptional regulator [Alginatibacterium sediminis]|uniref:LacI family DNA-binding transcriptional regulator n=1 Tax=Alginatibacterium sediminis TaxID=2164068 RepID=A0A420E6B3_9ALTE|nr:LacI family DNA-binding transcriptional regulator [Alginatibacterium sediminis]RKF13230.1 LacI family DNA-binding transcriptional regulator [Alginatibacterium sediminis]
MEKTAGRKLTLKEMAEQIGVSKATVSNAFNRPDQLSKQLRERILAQCEALGYSGPNMSARSLRTGKTGIIGVLLADTLSFNFSDPVANQFLEGLGNALDKQHVNMLLLPSCEENYQSSQVQTIPDGYIVYGQPLKESLMRRLEHQGKPLVTVDFTASFGQSVSVHVDNQKAACEAAMHAVAPVEHPRVSIFGLRLTSAIQAGLIADKELFGIEESISRRRLEGYREALVRLKVKPDMISLWNFPHNDQQQVRVMARGILSAPERPNVLLCMSDKIALAALDAARDLGIKVPQELRVVGFDDIPEAMERQLTTVHQPLREKGRIAADIVLQLQSFEDHVLSTELLVRNSCP